MIISTLQRLKVSLFFSIMIICPTACAAVPLPEPGFPTKSFVQIINDINIKKCKEKTPCVVGKFASTGSGGVIGYHAGAVIVLTAKHVCLPNFPAGVKGMILDYQATLQVRFWDDQYFNGEVLNVSTHPRLDLCAITIRRNKVPHARFSRVAPRTGDKIYSLSAPAGVWHPPAVPILSGIHSGNIPGTPNTLITIPAMGGSSGSIVLNKDKKIIGVIFAAVVGFHHIGQMSNYTETRAFIQESLRKARIKSRVLQSLPDDVLPLLSLPRGAGPK